MYTRWMKTVREIALRSLKAKSCDPPTQIGVASLPESRHERPIEVSGLQKRLKTSPTNPALHHSRQRNHMKTKTLAPQPPASVHEIPLSYAPRCQIYRQGSAGNFMAELKTDSPYEAVEMFVIISPAFEGGGIRIWDNQEQRVGVSVEWGPRRTRRSASPFAPGGMSSMIRCSPCSRTGSANGRRCVSPSSLKLT